ncbi:HD domain-containing protein [Methanolobus sediminis]|uniref:HD domain-containing protein n=1 Tax=Methanolobus sediminis TaxID=3072978 RepID=A0AA51UK91_9EURY|nr:HD domain-containing protein [Methanolobus sediminis]WMW25104.1 HD domain-containing protein [Methanolobus sediminis]
MDEEKFNELKTWFYDYVSSFYTDDCFIQQNVKLKEEHSIRVCENASLIAISEKLDNDNYFLAKTIALLHDVGRFKQISKYRTFKDSESENHAVLGVKVMKAGNVLSKLPIDEQRLILLAIVNHNRFQIKGNLDERTLFHAKLIRDADKLDIYNVLLEHHYQKDEIPNPALELGLPDKTEYSPIIVKEIMENKIASVDLVKTCNDMNLTRLAWLFDLNFRETFRLVKERGFIDKLIATLPDNEEIRSLQTHLNEYIVQVLRN